MATGRYSTVTTLLEVHLEFKIKEFSKQYFREALLDMGFNPAKDTEAPEVVRGHGGREGCDLTSTSGARTRASRLQANQNLIQGKDPLIIPLLLEARMTACRSHRRDSQK